MDVADLRLKYRDHYEIIVSWSTPSRHTWRVRWKGDEKPSRELLLLLLDGTTRNWGDSIDWTGNEATVVVNYD